MGRHLEAAHPDQAGLAADLRARKFAASINAKFPENWQRFAPHRQRLTRLVEAAGLGGRLVVLGAGNAADLELDVFTEHFDEVHLVDIDSDALTRAKARHQLRYPERVVLRGDVDLSGFIERIDEWGERFPEPQELGAAALARAAALSRELGRFDVALSTCVLSQLGLPYRRAWATTRSNWSNLTSALTGLHLATLLGISRRAGIVVCDVQTSQRVPELDDFREQSDEALQSFVGRRLAERSLELGPDPRSLLAWLGAPGLAHLVHSSELTLPWLWDLGDVRQLVYGVTFRHASANGR